MQERRDFSKLFYVRRQDPLILPLPLHIFVADAINWPMALGEKKLALQAVALTA